MAEYEVDSVNIEINAETKKAEDNLSRLKKSLNSLSKVKGVDSQMLQAWTKAEEKYGHTPFDTFKESYGMKFKPLSEIRKEVEASDTALDKLKKTLSDLGTKFDTTGKKQGIFLRSLKFSLVYTTIYSGMRAISTAFKTGTDNLYQYSKAINGEFAGAMDSMATSIQYFHNSVGAAISPLAEVFAPVLESLVDHFVEFSNQLNQINAILSGNSTWTKAVRVEKEYAEATTDAAEATKNLLAGFDELNVIQSLASKSAANTPDYSTMFEEVAVNRGDLSGWANGIVTAIEGVRGVMDYLNIDFRDVLNIAMSIGGTIALWKLSSGFVSGIASLVKNFDSLRKPVGLTIALAGFTLEADAMKNIGAGSTDIGDYLKAAIGAALGIGGLTLSFGAAGLAIGIAAAAVVGITAFSIGKKKAYYESEIGKYWANELAMSEINLETSVDLLLNVQQIDADIATVKTEFATLKELVDRAFSINDIPVTERTSTETETLRGLVQAINDMGIIELHFENSSIVETREQVTKLIDETERYYMKVAYQEGIIEAYKDQASAIVGLEGATGDLERTSKLYRDVQQQIYDKLDPTMRGWMGINDATDITTDRFGGLVGVFAKLNPDIGDLIYQLEDSTTAVENNQVAVDNFKASVKEAEDRIKYFTEILDKLDGKTVDVKINEGWAVKVDYDDTEIQEAINELESLTERRNSLRKTAVGMLSGYATGGFPTSGEIFMARENGMTEYVGSMGSRAAVANNDQIVEGIASGVAAANNDQNALLREQNALLRQLLAKETNVTISPSAALGRVNAKSAQMYEAMTGGY